MKPDRSGKNEFMEDSVMILGAEGKKQRVNDQAAKFQLGSKG